MAVKQISLNKRAGWHAKMAFVKMSMPWRNAHGPHPIDQNVVEQASHTKTENNVAEQASHTKTENNRSHYQLSSLADFELISMVNSVISQRCLKPVLSDSRIVPYWTPWCAGLPTDDHLRCSLFVMSVQCQFLWGLPGEHDYLEKSVTPAVGLI